MVEKLKSDDSSLEGFSVPFFHELSSDPPKLLRDLFQSNDEEKWIQICMVAKQKIEAVQSESPTIVRSVKSKSEQKPKSNSLDLTGSPLKCSFTLDDDDNFDDSNVETFVVKKSNNGPSYIPLSLVDARKCINQYNLATARTTQKQTFPPCWAVSDAEDGVLFVGARRLAQGLTVHKVSWSGPHERKDESLKLENFLKKHHNCVAPVGSNVNTDIVAKAIYNLSEQLGEITEDSNQMDGVSTLQVLLSWIRPRNFLERPPLQATAEVQMQVFPGDERMYTYKLFCGLELLKGFASGLCNQSITWIKPCDNEWTLQEEIENLFDVMKQYGPRSTAGSIKTETDDSLGEELITFKDRSDLDFTDRLWNCLVKVESSAQLSNAISFIIKTIHSAELRPFIYPKNQTKIVQIVQQLIRGSDEIPEMAGKLPLEILVEIGIEKLQRDYVHSLLSSYLASREDLAPFLSLDHLSDIQLSISNLNKLHTVLEIVCLCQMYLSTNQDCLRSIVRQSLKHLRTNDISSLEDSLTSLKGPLKFNFPISSAHVKEQLAKSNPSVWQCHVTTKSDCLGVCTTAHLTLEAPSEFIPVKLEALEDSMNKLDVTYFCTVASSITRAGF